MESRIEWIYTIYYKYIPSSIDGIFIHRVDRVVLSFSCRLVIDFSFVSFINGRSCVHLCVSQLNGVLVLFIQLSLNSAMV